MCVKKCSNDIAGSIVMFKATEELVFAIIFKYLEKCLEIFSLIFKILRNCTRMVKEAVVQRCPVKKMFLEISLNSQENACARVAGLGIQEKWDPGP